MCPLTVIVTHNKEWMIMTGAIPFSLAKEFCLIGGINQSPTECFEQANSICLGCILPFNVLHMGKHVLYNLINKLFIRYMPAHGNVQTYLHQQGVLVLLLAYIHVCYLHLTLQPPCCTSTVIKE